MHKRAWAAALLVLLAPAAQAEMVATSFKLQGSLVNQVWDIGNAGEIVGDAWDGKQFGFVYRGGVVERYDGPQGATGATAFGISDTGTVIGNYWTGPVGAFVNHAFIYQAGSYITTDYGLAGAKFIQARSISPNGRYVGGYYTDAGNTSRGFVYDLQAGQIAAIVNPSAGKSVIAQGVNSFGQFVGNMNGGGSNNAFLYDIHTGQLSNFAFSGTSAVAARAISDTGLVAGWLTVGGEMRAWMGNASGYQLIPKVNGEAIVAQGINDLGQVAGYSNILDGIEDRFGFIASPAVMPVSGGEPGVYSFNTAVVADRPVFIDPLVAVGYEYRIGAGNPLFKTVSLPAGLGDDAYEIIVDGQRFGVRGNEIFDFTAHGFAAGVAMFTVEGIEPDIMLDPNDPQAFVTRLTFAGSGMFTGTQTALTVDYTAPVPEPATLLMLLAGVGVLAARRRPS